MGLLKSGAHYHLHSHMVAGFFSSSQHQEKNNLHTFCFHTAPQLEQDGAAQNLSVLKLPRELRDAVYEFCDPLDEDDQVEEIDEPGADLANEELTTNGEVMMSLAQLRTLIRTPLFRIDQQLRYEAVESLLRKKRRMLHLHEGDLTLVLAQVSPGIAEMFEKAHIRAFRIIPYLGAQNYHLVIAAHSLKRICSFVKFRSHLCAFVGRDIRHCPSTWRLGRTNLRIETYREFVKLWDLEHFALRPSTCEELDELQQENLLDIMTDREETWARAKRVVDGLNMAAYQCAMC